MRKSTKIFGALAVAGVAAVSGSAFTAGNTLAGDNYAGYATATVSGATTTGIDHTLSTNGANIASTVLTFSTDLTAGHQVQAGFGSSDLETCTVDVTANTASCLYAGTGYATSSATSFVVAVS